MTASTFRALRGFLWTLVGLALAAVLWFLVIAPRIDRGAAEVIGRGDWQLETTEGQPFTAASLEGQPSALFFGFTHCPDVCPTTLGDILSWQDALGPEAQKLKVYFVTVDPARDTAAVLGDYVSWVPGVTGITGSEEETTKAVRAFRIFAQKVPLGGSDYTMDHSSQIMLFDAKGGFAGTIPYQMPEPQAVERLRRLLAGQPIIADS